MSDTTKNIVWAFQIRRASTGIVAHSLICSSLAATPHHTWPYSITKESPYNRYIPANRYHRRSRQIRRELSQPSGTTAIGFVKVFNNCCQQYGNWIIRRGFVLSVRMMFDGGSRSDPQSFLESPARPVFSCSMVSGNCQSTQSNVDPTSSPCARTSGLVY